ncbi:MAG: acetate CoA/acetoacetate CoA-transferase alpha subunit [Alteromonadaceae bacterium]|jgi:acetate CoA/acetoacetate CoA-transferase alpha subunit
MNKQIAIENAIAKIPDGASIMVGGFGNPGTPFALINELLKQGQRHLVIIKNDANEESIGISKLIENGQVEKLITSHIGLNKMVIDLMNREAIDVEFFPQGILAEKIRNAGAGCFGFLTDIGIDTEITDKSRIIKFQGKAVIIEPALYADFALIHARRSDKYGNLTYGSSAMNFNPLMAMAANQVIVETHNLVASDEQSPECIHTPSAFVTSIVKIDSLAHEDK